MRDIITVNPCRKRENWYSSDKLFFHKHPYPPYIPADATKLIVGTLPPPRFTTGDLRPGDVDFCYGSRDGQLWPILDQIFELGLLFETTSHAIQQRKDFLSSQGIGICDMVEHAYREKIDASDVGMKEVQLRDLIAILERYPRIERILFTGGNSKNGPEYFFRKSIKAYDIELVEIAAEVPRQYQFQHPITGKQIKTVSLTAPSGSANRAVGALTTYKELKKKHPEMTTVDFRVLQYKDFL